MDAYQQAEADALRERMATDGCLVVRGLVPEPDIARLRAELVAILAAAGLVEPEVGAGGEVAPVDAGRAVDVHGDPDLFPALFSLASLHRLPHHPRLARLARTLLELPEDGALLVHPKPALRAVFPSTPGPLAETPAHQDLLGMQGATDAYTCWVALSPCPRDAGVLAVARGSHRGGLRSYRPLRGARVATCDASDLDDAWVATDLAPGDVLVFHCLTVHRALPNRSPHVRLSVDARWQRATDPVSDATLRERGDLPWDTVYAGWGAEADGLRRYWERLPLDVVPFDPSVLARPPAT